MKEVRYIAYRYLTDADFFNLYKPPGAEAGGGGQKYIDFNTSSVKVSQWRDFFDQVSGVTETQAAKGPRWEAPIHSIGDRANEPEQTIAVYQRRTTSCCIGSQHLHSAHANRVRAWHPDNGFPEPVDATNRHQLPPGLAIFLARTTDGEVWAGWFSNQNLGSSPFPDPATQAALATILDSQNEPGEGGFVALADSSLFLDESTGVLQTAGATSLPPTGSAQARPTRRQRSENEIVESLFSEDEEVEDPSEGTKEVTVKLRQRNTKAVKDLKDLYGHTCQITGSELIFTKTDGTGYTEAHHLVPLGEGGADDPRNIIIVNPLTHRMLHYAHVEGLDFDNVTTNEDGSASLEFRINGEPYTIRWHPEHGSRVLANEESADSGDV